jgi:hypothetical protein
MKKLLLVLFLLPTIVFGRKFYFSSSTGNDAYTAVQAQNQATPWQTLQKLQKSVISSAAIFLPGDTICFKRGDVFANGYANGYASMQWVNDGGTYFTAPSGTPSQPIVITNYGSTSLPLPNWLYPSATYPVSTWKTREGRGVVAFKGVHDIVIDGIQSNDYRVPESDKINPGYTGGWIIGSFTQGSSASPRNSYTDSTKRTYMVKNFIIKNCIFNNIIYGIQQFGGVDSKVTNCIFTNFKSSADTAGTNDVLAGAFEAVSGIRCEFSNNYIKGAWAKSGRISSTNGLGGIAFDMFNLYNSKICYNTIIDCSGAFEIGNLDTYDTTAGFQYDTIAFNKIVNNSNFGYFHGSGAFVGNNHHIAVWNNVIISNWKDRQVGNGFGQDTYNDGQGFKPGSTNPWWFCRNPYNTLNVAPMRPTVTTTAGSNVITVGNASGISVGSVFFTDNDTLASLTYKTVTVTAINGLSITLSDAPTATRTTYQLPSNYSGFYLPLANQTWSQPSNPPYNNYTNARSFITYSSDATLYGSYIDTLFDSRNNIIYWTSGVQGIYDRNRYKRSANIYYYLGSARYATSLGGTLNYRGTKERAMTSGLLFKDTSTSVYPENWDLHLNDTSYARTNGVSISGFTTDFDGNSIVGVTPFIGMYKPTSAVAPTIVVTPSAPSTTVTCYGDVTTITVTASGGTAPYSGTGTFTRGAGFHTFTVTDANGYTGTSNITIIQPSDISATTSFTPITTQGGTTTVTVSSSGGTGIKTYSIDGGNYQATTSFAGVTAGDHILSVKDASGCTHDFNFTVTYNPSIIKSRLKFKN